MLKLPFFGKKEPETTSPETEAVKQLAHLLKKAMGGNIWPARSALEIVAKAHPEEYARVADVQGAARGTMALALLAEAARPRSRFHTFEYHLRNDMVQLAGRLVSAKGVIGPEQFSDFADLWIGASSYWPAYARVASVAEDIVADHGLTPELDSEIRSLIVRIQDSPPDADKRKQIARLRLLVEPENAAAINLPEPWQAPFRAPEWAPLLDHAAKAKANITEKWAKAMRPLLDAAGHERFLEAFGEAVAAVNRMDAAVDSVHSDTLRGLAYAAGLAGTPRAASLLGRLVVASGAKLPYVGARSPKGFAGAVSSLERMGTFESLAELSNARNRIKVANLSAQIAAALSRAAASQNLPLEELEELVVPTYALELSPLPSGRVHREEGREDRSEEVDWRPDSGGEGPGVRGAFRTETQDDLTARLEIVGTTEVVLRWFRGEKELKAPPAEAKELAKELRAAKKEIETALAAQRSRIEGLMMSGRTIPYAQWRERYLDHPLLGNVVRRLVWRFADENGEKLGIAPDGVPLDVEGRPLENLDAATVRLWHPIHAGVSAIEAWREFLFAREIRQPFKQAYREIYLLTAAEERTRTYSNRFAAHVLKQHQMAALARGRGWRYALQGFFDGGESAPTLDLPAWGLRAEYFVEVGDFAGDEGMTESGIALYVLTDQVRFVGPGGEAVPLDQVPPVVLSETMRDVDLFVGVASVGNDPTWSDQGERTGFGGYWRQVSFGDLSATAETRKAVLERLLPRLAVGKVSKIEGRFLVVKGKRRTYKIHLGSGNILMEPNDQYLCIVPGSAGKGGDKVYLPFEGDGVLAIILSKATLLMNDDRITDPTILRQL